VSLPEDEHEIEASRAPLLDHLTELRSRLIVCAWATALGFGLCMFFSKDILIFLLAPFQRAGDLMASQKTGALGSFDLFLSMMGIKTVAHSHTQALTMVSTGPLEVFFAKVKLAGIGAVVFAFPVLAFQLYGFVAPGLYKRERRAFLPFLSASPLLFLMGGALVYYIMLPFVLWFSLNQQILGGGAGSVNVQLLPKVSEYLSLVTSLVLAFGLCFQLPVIMALLALAGMVTTTMLTAARRYAIVGVFIVAAILTPPDPISMMSLALPGVLLYEVSILCVWLIERRRRREDAAEAAA